MICIYIYIEHGRTDSTAQNLHMYKIFICMYTHRTWKSRCNDLRRIHLYDIYVYTQNLEEQIQQLKTALHQMSMQSSRATQKALLLEIKCDKLRWVLQQNRVTDADFFPDESCQSVGEGVRSSLDDGDAGFFSPFQKKSS